MDHCGYVHVEVEVWPLAADESGVWLLSGEGPLRSWAVPCSLEPHAAVEDALTLSGVSSDHVRLVHSTSWRIEGTVVVLTWAAVIAPAGLVLDSWPDARPVSLELVDAAGPPLRHSANEPPTPRWVDVLTHALRHLHFLMRTDASVQEALAPPWPRHLGRFRQALAQMYR